MRVLGPEDVRSLSLLEESTLQNMYAAGNRVLNCHQIWMDQGSNVVAEMLSEVPEFYQWDHHPTGDVYDWQSHSQYFYHAHPPDVRGNAWGDEHGHFHTFLRPLGFPRGIEASTESGPDVRKQDHQDISHLVAVSMDNTGMPVRLFTTNRWVTGESWYPASSVKQFLSRFMVNHASPSLAANIWLSNLLMLYRPTINALLDARDAVIADHDVSEAECPVFEDRNLEVTSIIDIDVERQLADIEAAL